MGFTPQINGEKIRPKAGVDCLRGLHPEIVRELTHIFREEHRCEHALTEVRQRRHAAMLGRERKSLNGLGRPRMEIDDYSYHYWGQRLGYACWNDKQFLREFERDNPHARVKASGTRTQTGYRPPAPEGLTRVTRGARRSKTVYAL